MGRVVSDRDYRYELEKDVINIHYESPANEVSSKRLDKLFCRLSRSKTLECTARVKQMSRSWSRLWKAGLCSFPGRTMGFACTNSESCAIV